MPSKENGYGLERQNHPNRQVGRERYGPNNLPPGFEGSEDGPDNDDWINKAYINQSKPNPDYIGKPGGS